jgi:thioester reductase-like protein
MGVYFFTGFPGFITSRLIRDLLRKNEKVEKLYLLVLPEQLSLAKTMLERILVKKKGIRCSILPGDITKPDLGLDSTVQNELRKSVQYVFHLAAIYDLAVPEELAWQVNVEGTRNVNEWVQKLDRLTRYVYFSTAYVSGTREGRIYEHELDLGQSFKNHYERTKFEAELLVQALIPKVPVTIIRPGIVIGDSRTGETNKFDGLYFMLNMFDHLRFFPWIPNLGKGNAIGNFVPVDYITQATLYLAHQEGSVYKTYHLTDPHAYPMREVYAMLMEAYLNRKPFGNLPLPFVKWLLTFSSVRKWLHVEKEGLDYFTFHAIYDSTEAQKDLAGSGIQPPDLKAIIKPITEYYRAHKHEKSKHIPIQ